MRSSIRGIWVAAIPVTIAGIIIGCGGSGGGTTAPTGNVAVRSTSVAGYQSLQGGIAFPFTAVVSTAPPGSGIAAAFATRTGGLTLIPELNLYASALSGSGATRQINYFLDSAGAQPAGSMKLTSSAGSFNSYTKYPVTIGLSVNVAGGNLPCVGSGSITFLDSAGSNTMKGTLDLTKNNETVSIDLKLSDSNEMSGSFSVKESGTTINATDVSGPVSGDLPFNFALSPQGYSGTGTINLVAGSMSLTFTNPMGASSSIDSSGNLVIDYPGGTSQTIDNPLTASLLGSTATTGTTSGATGTTAGTTAGVSAAKFATPVLSAWAPSTLSGEIIGTQALYGSNAAGQVVGSVNNAPAFGSSFTATPAPLHLPSNTSGGIAYGINASGQIAGFVGSYSTGQAVIWSSPATTPTLLKVPSGTTASAAIGINASGQMVGYAYTASGEEFLYWSGPTATPIQVAPAMRQGFSPGGPTAIDDQGHLFGAEDGGDFDYLWSSPSSQPAAVPGAYGALGTNFSFSNAGLAGTANTEGIANGALLWAPPSYQPKPIPVSKSANDSVALSIDNAGDIVGDVYYGAVEHIAYWQPGKTEQLLDPQLAAAFPGLTDMTGQVVLVDGSVIASGLPKGATFISFYYFKRTDTGP